ncbi:dynein axonemal heavy chain 8-like isoform X2 [Coccinella septempunctata]|uniref:dynein axonemal heavy chain 8-like isoform X2 n=1 Tax=Coccinella septempunctata TaxID=41139 RepID=UPI001D079AAD|nr:dynein axonemal heavy chain 8-like isoform X2 [Coccinella septempunctata]
MAHFNEDDDFSMMMGVAKQLAASGKRQQSTKALEKEESLKERIVKYKDKRLTRNSSIQMPHRYICDMVATYLNIEIQYVIDGVCDADAHVDCLENFLSKNGIQAMIFYYQDGPPYEVETGRMKEPNGPPIKRIYVSPGMHPLNYKGVIVYKTIAQQVDMRNLNDVVFFIEFDLEFLKGNAVSIGSMLINDLIRQPLTMSKDWGDLLKSEAGLKHKRAFEDDFLQFCTFLDRTRGDLESVITFTIDPELVRELREGNKDQHMLDKEFIKNVEQTVRIWNKKMERALVQYQQLRREDEFVGPLVEVEYWRNQLSRFTSIIEFITKADCQIHTAFLREIASSVLKVWKKQINAVTDARNECSDNVKYLYSFESYCAPLYQLDPTEIPAHIPALLRSVRMIYNTSRYYNNTCNVTAVLVKVSNQIINVCRSYLNCNGTKTVWNQPKKDVLAKVEKCLDLYLKYYQCYNKVCSEMKEAGEKPFGCSEMYIFGKFETFKKRVEDICNVLQTTVTYSILQSSTIEGIEVFAQKFKDFFNKISSQKYDALNHRLPYFDKDYAEYRQNVVDTEWELEEFVGASLSRLQDVHNVLRLLRRFEKLKLPCLHLEERYLEAMIMFQEELENLRDRYNEERQSPLVPRNMPPASGRIRWIRQYYRRILQPMRIFKTKDRVIKHRKVQKCIQLFNALSMVFVHYEQLYHEAWYEYAAQVRHCLNSPIMVKHPTTRRYILNFDPHIHECIREAEYMYRLFCAVPDVGQIMVFCQDKILNSYAATKELIERNDELRSSIPPLFVQMMRAPLYKIEVAFLPAFSSITWTSMKIPEFCKEVTKLLDAVQIFIKEVKDMKEARIDEVLESIASTPLVYLPDFPLKPKEFYEENIKYGNKIVKELELKSVKTERAVIGLITKFLDIIDQEDLQDGKYDWLDPELAVKPVTSSSKLIVGPDAAFRELIGKQPLDLQTLKTDCVELFSYFNMKLTESLVKMVKASLEQLKQKATSVRGNTETIPMMRTKMQLQIPNTVINPDLTVIQSMFAQVVANVLECNKYIHLWGQRGVTPQKVSLKLRKINTDPSAPPKPVVMNYYKQVAENKEVIRLYMSLQGAMFLVKPDVASVLNRYLNYSYLWSDDREKIIDEFCERGPLPVEITEKFKEYEARAEEIEGLPECIDLGPIQIDLDEFKLALLVESNAWKYIMGNNLALRNKQRLNKMVDFIKTQEKIMSRKIKDLDDCRLAMQCLERIRDNFIEMDMELGAMEEAYAIFNRFRIDVPREDIERVDTLRFNFGNMGVHAKQTQENIYDVQAPLLEELTAGVDKFAFEVEAFDKDFEEKGPMVPGLEAREASDRVLVFQDRFDELWRKFEMYSSGEKLFGLEVKDYPILHKRKKEFNLLNKLYGLYLQVNKSIDGYYDILWSDVDTEVIIAELTEFQNRCRKLPKALKDWPAFLDLKKKIDDFSETCPLLELMANKAMKDRHWRRLSTTCNYNFDIDSPTFTLRNVMEAPLLQYKDDVEDICISAVKEKDIEAKLKQVIADWAVVDLSFSSFKARGELLLKGTETGEIIMLLEDSLMVMNSLLSNRYNAPFKKDIQLWVHKLVTTSEILEKWMLVQNLWVYLEAVFVGGDIAKQLPAEAKRFSNIDKSWVKIMARAHEVTNAVECCTGDETMGQLLPHLLEQLETCQKSLTGYLESKRLLFPRFFFISDPVLLEILGQSSDPTSIRPHLLSLFDAVASVDFDEKRPDCIINMKSDNGEIVTFEKMVQCQGGVEFWLNILLNTVKSTVQQVIAVQAQCFVDPEYNFVTGFQQFCGQGLAQSGSWGCFDEFNRIELPVLSVAAQQIYIVLQARKERKPVFVFMDGDNVSMNIEFGIFLTMNPGYAGRQELPENLKIMFRNVAMMVPDRQIIIRVKLASCGFKDNVYLARKFFTLYALCEGQLSKQVHYDFGLRNILSVLRTLGAQKRANPNDSEETTVMRVLRDMNLSKLIDEDEPLFLSLIEDMFPGIKLTSHSWKDLQKAVGNQSQLMGLVNYSSWNLKIVQLYETSLVRHGLMVMGPTGAGKTECMHCLMRSFTEMGLPHKELRMNPKAITAPQMFGRLDVATNDWTDGIFSTLWRRTLKFKKTDFCWLVLDGPVDAVWIENLNSVLDDNKTLTLANGDRIVMAGNCKLVFEPDNVDNASPATVSRMGMVFMSSSVLPWPPILDGWLKTRSQQEGDALRPMFGKIYSDAQDFVLQKLKPKMFIREAVYIRQCYDVLQGILDVGDETKFWTEKQLERLFLFSMMWSLGALLELEDRSKLEQYVLTHPSKMDWPKIGPNETIFEYLVNPDNGRWQHWSERVEEFCYPSDSILEFTSILVPNVDNVRTAFLIGTIAKQSKAVLLIGEQGTAKTVMIQGYLQSFDPEYKLSKSFNFSSATTPNMVQRIIESYIDKRVGTTYGPPAGKTLSVFIDDINMPVINDWGDQITNEIVRQLMECGGFYSLDKPGDFSTVVDVMFLAAMIHPGGGRNDIPHRLKRQFCVFNCTLPSTTSMDLIFQQIACGYFCPERFLEPVVNFVSKLIPLTRHLWEKTKIKMLPTPAKFHYVFNLRDLSRIWQGILTVAGDECKNEVDLLKLWRHECHRVISDRFTEQADKDWFIKCLKDTVVKDLGDDSQFYTDEEVFWVDFLREVPEATGDEPEDFVFEAPKIYEEIPSWEFLKEKLLSYMEQYNEQVRGSLMDMVFFHDAMVNLMIISRLIRTARGNALLVGVGGSGKQSLTKLASFIASYKSYQIQLTRSYNLNNLMDDIKYLYRVAGLEGSGITFIFTDNDIKEETFLESLNNILSSGEIANLFPKDELDEIQSELIPIMKKIQPKRPPTVDNLYDFFITRSRSNIHVVLCFSPVGEKFRSRALKFPGLISGCTVNWFARWPRDALIEVASHFLQNFEIVCVPEVKLELIHLMGEIQDGVAETCILYFERFRRRTFVTPKTFISFLDFYKVLYKKKFDDIQVLAHRMKTGLSKLVEAQASVDDLRKELAVKEIEVNKASEAAEEVLNEVLTASEIANKIKEEALAVKVRAENLVNLISVDQKEAEEKLLAAKPALDAAEAALLTIKASDIATVRKLGKPPYLILIIMDVVLIYFKRKLDRVQRDTVNEKDFILPSWNESLKMLADTRFLNKLQEYPKDTINAETIDLVTPYLKHELYTFETAKSVCGNVAGLVSWTIAMAAFYEVNKEVLPLKANLQIQQAKLNKAQDELNAAMTLLATKEEEVRQCQILYEEAMTRKQAVLDDAMKVKNKMDAATALINGLAGERIRWTAQLQQFKAETERLVGDVVILVGFLGYSGPFNQEFRNNLNKTWLDALMTRKIPVTATLSIIDSLTDTATMGEWNIQGLPTDELSIQNGIIVTTASRYPLLIDPQSQGKSWIKNKEKDNNLIVSSLNHKYFRNHIEDAVSLGYPMIIEDIGEELDPVLDAVLEKSYIKSGTSYKVKVGDKEVDVNMDFKVYMTTKLANPSYTPEIFARTSVVDFTVTIKGLEDQLLGRVILTEKRELETERTQLMIDVTSNRRKMSELEQNLLYKLTTTQGSLLDDDTVIGVLNVTKTTSLEVQEKLTVAKETEIKINAAREEFRPVATRGSVLYFLIVSMAMVNIMYQTSLVQFLERFDISMLRSERSPITSKRINFINEYMTYEIYKYKSRGLYERHKYMFVLLLTLKIDLERSTITHEEFQNFIKGGAALDLNTCPPKPAKWITDMTWLNLVELSNLRHYQYIVQQIVQNDKVWKTWFDKDAPEEAPFPLTYNTLDTFRKLLIVRAWCPDRTMVQSRKYIASSMGQKFAEPVILNFEVMYNESRALTPMVCFLSTGSDPTPYIEQLAKKLETGIKSISMGQGQEIHARKMMAAAMTDGFWALLQNCHLSLEYMNEVLVMFLDLEKGIGSVNPDFRLWITTEEHPLFPISLLQLCIKFTNEAPSGVRAGLLRTYTSMNQDMLDYSDAWQYIPLIYAISFLHTVVQERRKFGPLGWNIPYEYNSADWLASCIFVQNHLDEIDPKRGVSWVTLRYMLGEVHYGGRVTDDYDKRLLNTFCRFWFNDGLFEPTFEFAKGYKIVKFKQISDYLSHIDTFAPTDPPQVYGLHPNADITYQTNTTSDMLSQMLSIQPKESGGGGGETRESSVTRQAIDMLSKMPPNYDPFEVKERIRIMGQYNPLNIFLKQEIDRMQKVIGNVRTTLKDLLLAIEGTIIMNESLQDALDNIYDALVPAVWMRGSWAARTLGFWFTELLDRDVQFRTWCFKGRPPCFWMAGFFNPQGFLTAMKQEVARAHKGWALDQVFMSNEVMKMMKEETISPPSEGVYIYGLFLDGAGWDRRNSKLCESTNKVLYTILPVVFVTAIYQTSQSGSNLYVCPVYKKARRTDLNYITALNLVTTKNPDHWTLRGVALLCDIQ